MARVVVEVMPKPEILDPQGKAVAAALPRLGHTGITEVRQGKRFELEVADGTDDALAHARKAAEEVLSNPVIEDVVSVHWAGDDPAAQPRATQAPAGQAARTQPPAGTATEVN